MKSFVGMKNEPPGGGGGGGGGGRLHDRAMLVYGHGMVLSFRHVSDGRLTQVLWEVQLPIGSIIIGYADEHEQAAWRCALIAAGGGHISTKLSPPFPPPLPLFLKFSNACLSSNGGEPQRLLL